MLSTSINSKNSQKVSTQKSNLELNYLSLAKKASASGTS